MSKLSIETFNRENMSQNQFRCNLLHISVLEIYHGKSNVDSYDFITKNQKKVEIKSASKDFHKRIMVPKDQWHNTKDYYVGIKIFAFYNGYETSF